MEMSKIDVKKKYLVQSRTTRSKVLTVHGLYRPPEQKGRRDFTRGRGLGGTVEVLRTVSFEKQVTSEPLFGPTRGGYEGVNRYPQGDSS